MSHDQKLGVPNRHSYNAAQSSELRKALWRALGEASWCPKDADSYLDRLFDALYRNGLEVRLVKS